MNKLGLINNFADSVVGDYLTDYKYIGVGDSDTAHDKTQEGLQGSEQYFREVESPYPLLDAGSNNKISFQIVVPAEDAQFEWNEIVISETDDNSGAINRFVTSFPEKDNTEWTLEVTLTIEVGD